MLAGVGVGVVESSWFLCARASPCPRVLASGVRRDPVPLPRALSLSLSLSLCVGAALRPPARRSTSNQLIERILPPLGFWTCGCLVECRGRVLKGKCTLLLSSIDGGLIFWGKSGFLEEKSDTFPAGNFPSREQRRRILVFVCVFSLNEGGNEGFSTVANTPRRSPGAPAGCSVVVGTTRFPAPLP